MAKLFYKTNYTTKPEEGQIFLEHSMTIQGETYSMKELIERYARGQDLVTKPNQYLDAGDLENINKYFSPGEIDLVDLEELKARTKKIQSAIEEAQAKEKAAEKAAAKKAAEEAKEAELFEKFKKQQNEENK